MSSLTDITAPSAQDGLMKIGPEHGRAMPKRPVVEDIKVRKAAEDFEAVFLAQMLDTMYSGIATDGMFGGGKAEELFRSMLNEQNAKAISRNGGIGLADAVYAEMIRLQEGLR